MIVMRLRHPSGAVQGFNHWWGKYVIGFDPRVHCIECLVGVRSRRVNRDMRADGTPYGMTEAATFDYFYLCGVTRRWRDNFHLALRPEPEGSASAETFAGMTVDVTGAVAMPIPALPDGFQGLPASFTTCRNFQFGEAAYGERMRATAATNPDMELF